MSAHSCLAEPTAWRARPQELRRDALQAVSSAWRLVSTLRSPCAARSGTSLTLGPETSLTLHRVRGMSAHSCLADPTARRGATAGAPTGCTAGRLVRPGALARSRQRALAGVSARRRRRWQRPVKSGCVSRCATRSAFWACATRRVLAPAPSFEGDGGARCGALAPMGKRCERPARFPSLLDQPARRGLLSTRVAPTQSIHHCGCATSGGSRSWAPAEQYGSGALAATPSPHNPWTRQFSST